MEELLLTGELIRRVPSPDGPQAELWFKERNGDRWWGRCLWRRATADTEVFGDSNHLDYLNKKYGQRTVWLTA